MNAYGRETWTLHKPAVTGRNGLVASQHHQASAIGAAVLGAGGNAVDAAVASGLAIGVLEPWMSGLGGGGFMLVYRAAERRCYCIDFGMVAPRGLNPGDYPLTGETGGDLFGWPRVTEDRNLRGYPAMCVPGQVAGLALALERFGSRNWADSLAPAIELAEQGLTADWYATLKIAAAARQLAQFPESRRRYLPGGFPPAAEWGGPPPVIGLGDLPHTFRRLAEAGPEDFYRGELARALVADARAGGSPLSLDDLAGYQAWVVEAGRTRYRDAVVHYVPGLSAGPTLAHALELLADRWQAQSDAPDGAAFAAYADSLLTAYAERFARLGDSEPEPGCTTHLGVVDCHGNLVALTQTLLSVFGSKVVLPETGILMNNGVMWFDPRPGRPNSIAPGKRPLANMCPAIVCRDDGHAAALGASGGRRILPAVLQFASFLVDYRLDLEQAFRLPRIDVSGTDTVTLDEALDTAIQTELASRFATGTAPHGVYPNLFACPNAVAWHPGAGQSGAAFVPSPWAAVAGPD